MNNFSQHNVESFAGFLAQGHLDAMRMGDAQAEAFKASGEIFDNLVKQLNALGLDSDVILSIAQVNSASKEVMEASFVQTKKQAQAGEQAAPDAEMMQSLGTTLSAMREEALRAVEGMASLSVDSSLLTKLDSDSKNKLEQIIHRAREQLQRIGLSAAILRIGDANEAERGTGPKNMAIFSRYTLH